MNWGFQSIPNMLNEAYLHLNAGRLIESKSILKKVLNLQSKNIDALLMSGAISAGENNLPEAIQYFSKAIKIDPNNMQALFNRCNAYVELGVYDKASIDVDSLLRREPNSAEVLFLYANVCAGCHRVDEAIAMYNEALRLAPDFYQALLAKGCLLVDIHEYQKAIAVFDSAIALQPDIAEAYANRGNALASMRDFDQALKDYRFALSKNPLEYKVHNNLGSLFFEMGQLDNALACFNKSIEVNQDYAEDYNNRANILRLQGNFENAISDCQKAVMIRPQYAKAYVNHGNILVELKRMEEALSIYRKAQSIQPDYEFLRGSIIHAQMHLCEWAGVSNEISELREAMSHGQELVDPFIALSLWDDLDVQQIAARTFVKSKKYANLDLRNSGRKEGMAKIKIGYYSADFREHPVSRLIAELLESHDRHEFEIAGFYFGPKVMDPMRERVTNAFDKFFDVSDWSALDIAKLSRENGIDIAIDLMGYTMGCQTEIFAYRCAPIQVNFLGYPGTMGAPFIDYIISDAVVIPEGSRSYYSEKSVSLPGAYLPNDSTRRIPSKLFERSHFGLSSEDFVFCCLNNSYKITPEMFRIWMEILNEVKGSVLWLYDSNPTATQNMKKEAIAYGIDESRLVFTARMNTHEEYMARYLCADLFLDTFPYNAHTMASDALWSGLPVLTLQGKSFVSRVASSLLTVLGLPELICFDKEAFKAKAIEIAENPAFLMKLKDRLRQNLKTSSLFDGKLFARHLEAAYKYMCHRQASGSSPDHFNVMI